MSDLSSEELVQKLVESFRSLLDEALVVAIVSDYELTKDSEYESAKTILEGLAKDVSSEEATGFNPSGMGESPEETTDGLSTTETSNSQHPSRANDTDTTTSDLTPSSSGGLYSMPVLDTFDEDSEESKILSLQNMFTELKEYDIKNSLKQANGDFQTALDNLLNIQYLKSTGQQPMGIDGFFRPEDEFTEVSKKKRRNRKKGKRPLTADDLSSPTGATSPDALKNMKRQDEIAYLADRLDLPFDEVSEIYCRKRFASGHTALEILDQHISLGIEAQDDASKQYAKELADKYRNVPEQYMATIVQVTGSIPQWSDDIAALLSKHFTKHPWTKKLPINYTLTPLPDEDVEGFETVSSSRKKAAVSKIAGQTAPKAADRMSYAQASDKATQYTRARREAASSAAQLNRRGASNPLYRQAAGYYAGVAREQGRYEKQASSTAADILVEENSTPTQIDLHGVYVQDGVRIARARVQSWWNGLGEFRSEKARQQPFTVVTGLGRHSAGGVSQLRQAVAAALLQEGWDMRVETGRFVVRGRR